jgi:hypothetical protein
MKATPPIKSLWSQWRAKLIINGAKIMDSPCLEFWRTCNWTCSFNPKDQREAYAQD